MSERMVLTHAGLAGGCFCRTRCATCGASFNADVNLSGLNCPRCSTAFSAVELVQYHTEGGYSRMDSAVPMPVPAPADAPDLRQ